MTKPIKQMVLAAVIGAAIFVPMFVWIGVASAKEQAEQAKTTQTAFVIPVAESEPEEQPEEVLIHWVDIPLSEDLQNYIVETSYNYGIDPAIIMAMIDRESDFITHQIGDGGNSYGLMQIQPRWHQERMNRLGVTDLLDPYQNVLVGIDYLAEMLDTGNGIEWALMAYNGGQAYANRLHTTGQVSTYAVGVLEGSAEWK